MGLEISNHHTFSLGYFRDDQQIHKAQRCQRTLSFPIGSTNPAHFVSDSRSEEGLAAVGRNGPTLKWDARPNGCHPATGDV